jgi:hypothetical protein
LLLDRLMGTYAPARVQVGSGDIGPAA